jgi:hypothetical protein
VLFRSGKNPFANSAGKVVMAKAVSALFDKIVTEEYDVDIVELTHRMLSKVMFIFIFIFVFIVILMLIINCYLLFVIYLFVIYLLVAESRRETNSR